MAGTFYSLQTKVTLSSVNTWPRDNKIAEGTMLNGQPSSFRFFNVKYWMEPCHRASDDPYNQE